MLLHYRLLVYPCSKFGTEADHMLMTSSEHKTFVTGTLSRGKGVHREGRGCSHMLAVNRTCQVSPIIIYLMPSPSFFVTLISRPNPQLCGATCSINTTADV